jgi:hypothetical protein
MPSFSADLPPFPPSLWYLPPPRSLIQPLQMILDNSCSGEQFAIDAISLQTGGIYGLVEWLTLLCPTCCVGESGCHNYVNPQAVFNGIVGSDVLFVSSSFEDTHSHRLCHLSNAGEAHAVCLVVGTFCNRPATGEKAANKIWFSIMRASRLIPKKNDE